MPQKKYDLRNQFEQAARRYSNDEERSTRIQAVMDAHHKQAQMPKKYKLPTFDCPACHAKNIMFAGDAVAKNETILTLLEENGVADYVIVCPKCKQYIGVRRHVGTQVIRRSFRTIGGTPFEYTCTCSIIELPEHIKTVKSLWALVSFMVRSITILAKHRKNIRPCKAFGCQTTNIRK